MQIADCLADVKSYISQWAYLKDWPQLVWAGPSSPHVRTMWKKLDGFINYLTAFFIRVARAHHSAHTHIYTLTCKKTHIHALIGAGSCKTHTDDRIQTYCMLTYSTSHLNTPPTHTLATSHYAECELRWALIGRWQTTWLLWIWMKLCMSHSLWHDSFIHIVQSHRHRALAHAHKRTQAHKHWLLSPPCH